MNNKGRKNHGLRRCWRSICSVEPKKFGGCSVRPSAFASMDCVQQGKAKRGGAGGLKPAHGLSGALGVRFGAPFVTVSSFWGEFSVRSSVMHDGTEWPHFYASPPRIATACGAQCPARVEDLRSPQYCLDIRAVHGCGSPFSPQLKSVEVSFVHSNFVVFRVIFYTW